MAPAPTGGVWAVVLAAGAGGRFGDRKQFARIGGSRMVDRAVATAALVSDAMVVVLPEGHRWSGAAGVVPVTGGPTRCASVRAGLAAVAHDAEVIVVADAAHPLASPALFSAVVAAVRGGADAAIPVVPVTEVLKLVDGDQVTRSVPKTATVMAQIPHAFAATVLRAAHEGEPEAVEDSELVQHNGATVVTVPGDVRNLHVTTPAELTVADLLASEGQR